MGSGTAATGGRSTVVTDGSSGRGGGLLRKGFSPFPPAGFGACGRLVGAGFGSIVFVVTRCSFFVFLTEARATGGVCRPDLTAGLVSFAPLPALGFATGRAGFARCLLLRRGVGLVGLADRDAGAAPRAVLPVMRSWPPRPPYRHPGRAAPRRTLPNTPLLQSDCGGGGI
ncbi:MAG TPA: hypothetical protein VME92_22770 [Acetobacteraceae bacterium]|nr:hypothetical protein [Acetobacteraceae bacterium]